MGINLLWHNGKVQSEQQRVRETERLFSTFPFVLTNLLAKGFNYWFIIGRRGDYGFVTLRLTI